MKMNVMKAVAEKLESIVDVYRAEPKKLGRDALQYFTGYRIVFASQARNELEKILNRTSEGVNHAAIGLLGVGTAATSVVLGVAVAVNLYRAATQQDLKSAAHAAIDFSVGIAAFYAADTMAHVLPKQVKSYISNFNSNGKLPVYLIETTKAFSSELGGKVTNCIMRVSRYAGSRGSDSK